VVRTLTQLAEDLGFEVADTGNLAMARYLEPLAMGWIHLAIVQQQGRDFAFPLVRREISRVFVLSNRLQFALCSHRVSAGGGSHRP
jgi:hypothetical protein